MNFNSSDFGLNAILLGFLLGYYKMSRPVIKQGGSWLKPFVNLKVYFFWWKQEDIQNWYQIMHRFKGIDTVGFGFHVGVSGISGQEPISHECRVLRVEGNLG